MVLGDFYYFQMKKSAFWRNAIVIPVIMIVSFATSSCGVLIPVSLVSAGATRIALDERSIGTQIDDKLIARRINSKLRANKVSKNVTVSVMEGRALLVGIVENEQDINISETSAWSIMGVREVINEIYVGKLSAYEIAKDLAIVTTIKTRLSLERNLSSTNYKVFSVGGAVYLIGIAQNQEECDTVIALATSVSNVHKVVSHVILTTDQRRLNRQ